MTVTLTVLARPDCELCEHLGFALQQHLQGRAELVWHDVDERDDWRRRYGLKIPVVLDANGLLLMSGAFDATRLPPALR
ncbi:glutaredoxin family protein [Polycyclovorans algicola]|uniref:glutaredoxin family protein n=1 Tax=Polycyclovorans algicola TaxID=616992 RepID=UPI0004A752C4|nr:glutaredoxin family protein [Polycyclovorans algicola]